jgi:transcriptional regulator with XRE-family HTH domain
MSSTGLAEELRRIRGIRGVSLRDVEKATDISNAYLSQLENGNATKPSPHILHKLAEFYDIPYLSLMRAAGYLRQSQTTGEEPSAPTSIQTLLMSAKLTDEETEKVADFIQFLRIQSKKGKGSDRRK